ncbi:dihydrofolate reductase family protein [Litorihabitans aurantiacus]|uniref:Dihydrofolate reductase n=1 Tax=Litorihabitans aurantiacus TaxID=1930061 RepID=A0AA37XGW5_9MICO|nr:dihydrofolate reductase family protein [Litorihabitans aurantiacus]GMA33017.1 dihydrofolate reductase [Litorihabitans aurantiacus]
MGHLHLELFATLDLVGQAPGGPEEDPEGFAFGGWQAPLISDVEGEQVAAAYAETDALLLGRRTYDIFAAYWPQQTGWIADLFNRIPKYVASRSRLDLDWDGAHQLGPGLPAAVREVRERHANTRVVGSLDLVQTLLNERLADRLDLWLHPLVLGEGKKIFDGGAVPANLRLLAPAATGPTGTVHLRYSITDEVPATGTMA